MLKVDENRLRHELNELSRLIKEEIYKRFSSPEAVNHKTGENLSDSDLKRSVKVDAESGGYAIVFQIADYYEYIVNGWKKSGNFPGTFGQFISNIERWIRKKRESVKPGQKNIQLNGRTENQVAWAIVNSIYKNGIAPRPFLGSGYNNGEDPSKVLVFLDEMVDNFCDETFQILTEPLDAFFS